MNIVFPIFDGVTQLDFTGPAQMFSMLPGANVYVAATSLSPIPTDCGFSIGPNITFEDCPDADILCIPGGYGTALACGNPAFMRFVGLKASNAKWITSVCTGMFVLGKLGLLKGKRVTSHWAFTDLIAECGGIYEPGRFVVDGNIITGGGVTAGLDFALKVMAVVAGEETAKNAQLLLEYDPCPPFDSGNRETASKMTLDSIVSMAEDSVQEMREVLR